MINLQLQAALGQAALGQAAALGQTSINHGVGGLFGLCQLSMQSAAIEDNLEADFTKYMKECEDEINKCMAA